MQIKLTRLISLLVAVSLLGITAKVAAQQPLSGLEQALKDTGWSVQQEQDGSLILKSGFSTTDSVEKKNTDEDNWSKMQRELQAAGWTVNREADGTLVLFPQATTESEVAQQINPMLDTAMQQQLRQAGWGIAEKSDGSILLYLPEQPVSAQPLVSPGTLPSIALSLPVDNWQEAYDISQSWLDRQPPYRAAVGKIRKVLRIYVVSIVSEKAPHTLLQQIAIRSSDGAVIVLN
jgi:hypothetical protein